MDSRSGTRLYAVGLLNNKSISIGIIAVIVLAIIYIGNKVMTTTPQSGALGQTQYKVVPALEVVDAQEQINIGFNQMTENQLNKYGKDGWELVEITNIGGGVALILKKD